MQTQSSQRPSLRLFGILLMVGAVIGMVGNSLHPHAAEADAAAATLAIARNDAWVLIHLAIIAAILLATGGLLGLSQFLHGGAAEAPARLGFAAAAVGAAVVTVSTSIDGFANKALALAWANAPTAETDAFFRVLVGVKDVDFAIWSAGMLIFFGLTFLGFGAALADGRYFPAWFGWAAIVSGVGSTAAALIQIANVGEVQLAETLFFASSMLATLWLFAAGVLLWRAAQPTTPAEIPFSTGSTPRA